jgi:hypothetical protein
MAKDPAIWYNIRHDGEPTMSLLDRAQLIAQLHAAAQGDTSAQELAAWAFDQFYAEEAGAVEFEPGYRRVIAGALDDLMFADQPGFQLAAADLQQLVAHLQAAEPALDDEDDDDPEDADDSDDQS